MACLMTDSNFELSNSSCKSHLLFLTTKYKEIASIFRIFDGFLNT